MQIINLGVTLFNNYLLKFDNGCILIDAGYTTTYQQFLEKLSKNNISLEEIKYVVITHVHNDHIGYLKELLENTMVVPIVHSLAEGRLMEGRNRLGDNSGALSRFLSMLTKLTGKSNEAWEPINLDDRVILAENAPQYLKEKGFPLTLVTLPGHTPDSIGLISDDGILFCGDMFINGFPAIHRKTFLIENLEDYIKSWKEVIKLSPICIYPGHGKKFLFQDVVRYEHKAEKIKLWKNS